MRVYSQEDVVIERWQWNDPSLRNLSEVVVGLLKDRKGGRVLDLGCGSGRLAAALATEGFEVDGIDVEERVVEMGRQILKRMGLSANLYAGDVFDPEHPVSRGGYDIVICTEVLEHVDAWRELLARGGELLKPGGTLIISAPRDPGQYTVIDKDSGHLRRFRDWELTEELRPGYDQIELRRLGFPSMRSVVWLYTTWLRLSGRSHASTSRELWREPGLSKRMMTGVFYRLIRLDNLFSRLPLGATLVVRARKMP